VRQLAGLDSVFIYLENSGMPMHIGGLMIYDPVTAPDGRPTFEQIVDEVRGRLGRARSLRQRLAKVPFEFDIPYWVEDAVDVDYHIGREELPAPGNWRQLSEQVSRFLERPLDMKRPLWELCVIEGLNAVEGLPENAFAIAIKVHHASNDGVGGIEMVGALHDAEPLPPAADSSENTWHVEHPSQLNLLAKSVLPAIHFDGATVSVCMPKSLIRPMRLIGAAAGLGAGYFRRLSESAEPTASDPSPGVPYTRFNGAVGPHRTIGGVQFALADVKAIKNALPGMTVNDAVLAIVGGAMRGYLLEARELPDVSLVAGMPMSVRTDDERGGDGNRLTVSAVPLFTDVADPMQRVRLAHQSATKTKAIRHGGGGRSAVDGADAIPAVVLGLVGRLVGQLTTRFRLANTVVTNVPGPDVPMYLCGARMIETYGYALAASGIGVAHVITSYCGNLTVGFQAGSTMIPDPERYEYWIRQAFNELVKAAADLSEAPVKAKTPSGRTRR
jgi:diacylglycerol O-acyltransferase / wax synthase